MHFKMFTTHLKLKYKSLTDNILFFKCTLIISIKELNGFIRIYNLLCYTVFRTDNAYRLFKPRSFSFDKM